MILHHVSRFSFAYRSPQNKRIINTPETRSRTHTSTYLSTQTSYQVAQYLPFLPWTSLRDSWGPPFFRYFLPSLFMFFCGFRFRSFYMHHLTLIPPHMALRRRAPRRSDLPKVVVIKEWREKSCRRVSKRVTGLRSCAMVHSVFQGQATMSGSFHSGLLHPFASLPLEPWHR